MSAHREPTSASPHAAPPVDAGQLGPEQHARTWQELDGASLDVLVIGGGVTGAGVALDAATRGLRTALIEARDLASGTSSRSSKLFHGGLRYLEQLDVGLVREALRERELMLTRLAPHLVKPVTFLYPLRGRMWERPYVGAGLLLYDTLGGGSSLPRHRHLTRRGALAVAPGLRPDALVGAVRYSDARADDARHTMTVARTAAAHGATVRTSTEVVQLRRDGHRIVGASLRDVTSGATIEVDTRVVINCGGVWTDEVQAMSDHPGQFRVRASKGIHLLIPRERIRSGTGLILRTETSVLFVIPWEDHWIVGTTDTDWALDKAHPAATRADIDYLLERVNRVLRQPLRREDITGVYAGLRPLLHGESEATSKLSREHAVARSVPGLVSVAGGKYTTYRVMAADAVDLARADLGAGVPDSITAEVPLLGAHGYRQLRDDLTPMTRRYGLSAQRLTRLLDRYGSLIHEVLAPIAEDPSLATELPGAPRYLLAEVRYAATHEGAHHLDDLLARRTRISIETSHRGTESAAAAAVTVAPVLGWDADRLDAEVATYRARVAAERASQEQLDDVAADVMRRSGPDTRRLTSHP